MRVDIDRDSVTMEFKIAHDGEAERETLTIDVVEASDLIGHVNQRTKAAQNQIGCSAYYTAVRDDILIEHYKIKDASYTMATIFCRMVTEACMEVEKKTTMLVESLIGSESTPANGQDQSDESGLPTAIEYEPPSRSNAAKSPTAGPT